MSTYYYALRMNGDHLFDNFPYGLVNLIDPAIHEPRLLSISLEGKKIRARIGKKTGEDGVVFVLTTEEKFIKRHKLFKELLAKSVVSLKSLIRFQQDILDKQNDKTEEFIHNVTSLNSYSIQDLFAFIPQSILTENINKQSDIVRAKLTETPNVAVKTFLSLIKYNLAMKVEFSVFERTLKPYVAARKITHSIREIILSILQIFIEDFERHRIEVTLDACEKRISVDYDSLFVSLYYLLDNAVKYCCPSTTLKIIFKEEQDSFSILFIMISIRIEDDEIEKLSNRGYRSARVQELGVEGHGIGMYRILKTLKINNAELEVIPRFNEFKKRVQKIDYEGNLFKIKFMGQQDWFKL